MKMASSSDIHKTLCHNVKYFLLFEKRHQKS